MARLFFFALNFYLPVCFPCFIACSATFSFSLAGELEYCLGIAQEVKLTPFFE